MAACLFLLDHYTKETCISTLVATNDHYVPTVPHQLDASDRLGNSLRASQRFR